jgi:hypothetical protein
MLLKKENNYDVNKLCTSWFNFITGFFGKELILRQTAYYTTSGSRKTGHQWASS